MSNRVQRFFNTWYVDQRKYTMSKDDWLYCGQLTIAGILAVGLGLAIGFIWLAIL